MIKRVRMVLWALVGLAAAGGVYLALYPPRPDTFASSSGLPLDTIGGPFTLVGSDGQPFSSSKLAGKPAALFFGFTHCPDVCPTTLARLTKLRKQLGDDGFSIVFITVDPERDRPEDVGRYATLFDTPVIGLTGSPAQIDQVKKQFGVFSQKVPTPGGDYSVDHTATVFLLDRNGKFVATLSPEEGNDVALDKLRRIAA
jgi:protein SCO1